MERLTFERFDAESEAYDRAVLRTPEVDQFCTSSLWLAPSVAHLMTPLEVHIYREADAYVALAASRQSEGILLLHPLEAMWGLSCPLVGPDPRGVVELFLEVSARCKGLGLLLLTGLAEESALARSLLPALTHRYPVARGPVTRRHLANLSDGLQGFLARRSAAFRRGLRRAEARARARDLRFETADECDPAEADESFERILGVERRSWKGASGVGIDREPMRSFYREMNRRLVRRKSRRLVFARIDGEDVAYVLGGVLGRTYRGLQFSFDRRFSRLALGNLCQIEEIRRSAEMGANWYDLGTEAAYKKRWGERVFATSSLLVQL